MKKYLLLCAVLSIVLISCYLPDDCIENINKLPMYGRVKKCTAQIEADSNFLKGEDKHFKSRKAAAIYFAKRGWDFYYQQKPDTSMFRFNQAWMLDSLNAEVYWGFANLTGMKRLYKESLPLFEKAIKLDSINAKIYISAYTSYGNMFDQTKDVKYLDTGILYLKKADRLNPSNASINAFLAGAYSQLLQKDSARKYLKIAEKIDPNAVHPDIRKMVASH
ncbi:tetratricopeptide repeat protein [Mucilaginibacter terrae]|uniref:tetratricopeptide repeat protein n=1 Tax=Mucilaginibacter terrae TaxID=1955052 RepID=UPI003639CF08